MSTQVSPFIYQLLWKSGPGEGKEGGEACTYRVTVQDGKNLPLTYIWNVPSSCLGSR